jgi:hypothetical protein
MFKEKKNKKNRKENGKVKGYKMCKSGELKDKKGV